MNAVWMRVRAELRTERRAVFALALLIAISGAAVLAPLAGARRTQTAYDRFLAEANTHDVETNEGVPGLGYDYDLDLDAVAALPEVAEHQDHRVFIVGIRTETTTFPTGSEAVVVRPDLGAPSGLNRTRIFSGRLPDPDRVDEVAVGYGLHVGAGVSRQQPIHVGDTLTLELLSPDLLTKGLDGVQVVEELRVKVVGVLLQPGSVPPSVRYGQVYATRAFEDRFRDSTANARGLFVKLERGDTDLSSFKAGMIRLAKGGNVQFLTANDQDTGIRRSIDIYVVALQAFVGLAAAAALMILTQTLVRQLTLGSDDHPALRSLGMTPGQITAAALIRTGIAAGIGVVVAAAVALLLSPLFPLGTARVVEPSPGFSFDALVLLGGAFAFLLLILLFTVPAAWRAGRRAEGRDAATQEGRSQPSRFAAWLSRGGAPTSVVAGVRLALERGRGRSATPVGTTIVGSAVAVASLVTLIAFGTSMRNLVDTPRLYGWNWDALAGNPYAPDIGAPVNAALSGVRDVEEFSSGTTNIRVQLSRPGMAGEDTQALGLTARKGEVFPPMLDGRWPVDDDEVALGTTSMRSLDLSVGDTVAVSFAGEPIRMTVVGRTVFPVVGDQYGGELGRGAGFTLEGIRRIVPKALENIFPVRFRPGVDVADLPREARNLFFFDDETDVILGARPLDLVNLSKVTGAPLALSGLVGLLGIATIAHALTTSVRRRRRDLAILKTIGFVKSQIWAAVVAQATTLAVAALLIGIPLGLVLGRTAWLSFANGQGVVPEVNVGLAPMLALIPLTLLLANMVAALPGSAAAKLTPASVLRTE